MIDTTSVQERGERRTNDEYYTEDDRILQPICRQGTGRLSRVRADHLHTSRARGQRKTLALFPGQSIMLSTIGSERHNVDLN